MARGKKARDFASKTMKLVESIRREKRRVRAKDRRSKTKTKKITDRARPNLLQKV